MLMVNPLSSFVQIIAFLRFQHREVFPGIYVRFLEFPGILVIKRRPNRKYSAFLPYQQLIAIQIRPNPIHKHKIGLVLAGPPHGCCFLTKLAVVAVVVALVKTVKFQEVALLNHNAVHFSKLHLLQLPLKQ